MSCLSLLFSIILSLLLLLSIVVVEGNARHDHEVVQLNVTTNSTSSPWLKRIIYPRAQARGCATRPWICNSGGMSPQRVCCNDRCVDVTTDPMNCAFCGIRCPFSWLCCQGICINVNVNPFHCGRCSHRCAPGRMCVFGMCGYAQPGDPPFPFPLPPGFPGPPFPFPPGLPGPPFPFPPGFPGGPTLPKQDA